MLKHLPHYLSLFGILVAGAVGFYLFSYDKTFQIGIALALSTSYISWGLIHHTIHKDISLNIIFEYIAIAILGLTIVLALIFSN